MSEVLLKDYRGDVVENVHYGNIAVVNYTGQMIAYLGDIKKDTFFRSASKPIQCLPAYMHGLHKKYGFTPEETAIFNGSHWGSTHHIKTLKSILAKSNLQEGDMIMKPSPSLGTYMSTKLTKKLPFPVLAGNSKLQHNCSGKHASLLLLQRELTGSTEDYWKIESPAQQEVLSYLSVFTNIEASQIKIGTDGCGVPVFAVPLYNIALSYAKLAKPASLHNNKLEEAVHYNTQSIHAHPEKINDFYNSVYYLNEDHNFIAKDGANGVMCIGIKDAGIGIAMKLDDGLDSSLFTLIIPQVLEQLGYGGELADTIRTSMKTTVINDNGLEVGYSASDFILEKP